MSGLQTETKKPLLVVKYVWWRVLYTQIWNLIFIGIGSIVFVGDCSYLKCLINILLLIVGVIGMYSFFEILMFKQLSFYHDRIVKTYYFFGDRIFYFTNQTILRAVDLTSWYFISFYGKSKESFARISIPIHAIGLGKIYQQILSTLSIISGRNTLEFGDTNFIINPLIKQTQQGEQHDRQ